MGFKSDSRYKMSDHAFTGLSILYAILITDIFNTLAGRYSVDENFEFLRTINETSLNDWMITLWICLLMFFIFQSWWASRLDQDNIISLFQFIMILMQPVFLIIYVKIILSEPPLNDINKNILLWSVMFCGQTYLIGMRISFSGLKSYRSEFIESFRNYKSFFNFIYKLAWNNAIFRFLIWLEFLMALISSIFFEAYKEYWIAVHSTILLTTFFTILQKSILNARIYKDEQRTNHVSISSYKAKTDEYVKYFTKLNL